MWRRGVGGSPSGGRVTLFFLLSVTAHAAAALDTLAYRRRRRRVSCRCRNGAIGTVHVVVAVIVVHVHYGFRYETAAVHRRGVCVPVGTGGGRSVINIIVGHRLFKNRKNKRYFYSIYFYFYSIYFSSFIFIFCHRPGRDITSAPAWSPYDEGAASQQSLLSSATATVVTVPPVPRRRRRRPARPPEVRVATRRRVRRVRVRGGRRDRVLLERAAWRFRSRRHTGRSHERRRVGHRSAGPRGHQRFLGHADVRPEQPQVVQAADHADVQVRQPVFFFLLEKITKTQ